MKNVDKIICPLTKKDLNNSCPNCKFVVKYDNEIIGCGIKHIARNIFANKELAKDLHNQFNNFKQDMKKYG